MPDGVSILDARDILPEDRMLRYKENGSFALGSNLFRYELLKRGLGYWIDADVYFVQRLEPAEGSYVFGWEDDRYICSAVLHIPKDAQLLIDLLAFVNADPVVPPWWLPQEQERQQSLAMHGRSSPLEDMPWATAGPKAITHFVKTNNLTTQALPPEVFYPVHWSEADDLFAPEAGIWQRFTPRTKAVHLWNHLIDQQKRLTPVATSFIGEICKLQAVDNQISNA